MQGFLKDRNDKVYEIKGLTRRQKIELQGLIGNIQQFSVKDLDKLYFDLLKLSYPNLTQEEYDDLMDYNEEQLGYVQLYEKVGYIVEDVFMQLGGDTKMTQDPYLVAKREQKMTQETQRVNGVNQVI